ncbi:hypothetical protein ACTNFI_02275 [Coxiella burnetii]|uniref:hypothetical protein n=1 Tax=Coxiella burnetii TaxID=777 RepID=UPI001EDE79BA|nr:hypothetical protein [Coxiella burnetii]UYK69496.1 hypothetical protein OHM78_09225 [Coxiella burnetii]
MENCVKNIIHLTLKELIEHKSRRDRSPFNIYQLAKAIQMPHSMLVKLIHKDPLKRVNNPRIDTLARIVDFFNQDGFDVTIDDLINGFKTKTIEVATQTVRAFSVTQAIPLYSMALGLEEKIGMTEVKLTQASKNAIALFSDEDIKPIFKRGSIFIIDMELPPEHDTLIAINDKKGNKINIQKIDNNIASGKFNGMNNDCQIIGVVIQVNIKI